MLKRIVVGTDGSRTASTAVERAVQIARPLGAEVLVVSAYPKEGGSAQGGSIIELCRRNLDEVKAKYENDPVNLRTTLAQGGPADALLDVAEKESADLIVVGNVGMAERKRIMLGNVPNTISHHAPCSVLIVHTSSA